MLSDTARRDAIAYRQVCGVRMSPSWPPKTVFSLKIFCQQLQS